MRQSNELLFIEIQGLKENIISAQSISENCQDLQSINDRLRIDLRESLKKNFELQVNEGDYQKEDVFFKVPQKLNV